LRAPAAAPPATAAVAAATAARPASLRPLLAALLRGGLGFRCRSGFRCRYCGTFRLVPLAPFLPGPRRGPLAPASALAGRPAARRPRRLGRGFGVAGCRRRLRRALPPAGRLLGARRLRHAVGGGSGVQEPEQRARRRPGVEPG